MSQYWDGIQICQLQRGRMHKLALHYQSPCSKRKPPQTSALSRHLQNTAGWRAGAARRSRLQSAKLHTFSALTKARMASLSMVPENTELSGSPSKVLTTTRPSLLRPAALAVSALGNGKRVCFRK